MFTPALVKHTRVGSNWVNGVTPGFIAGIENQATNVYYQRGCRFWGTGVQKGSGECCCQEIKNILFTVD